MRRTMAVIGMVVLMGAAAAYAQQAPNRGGDVPQMPQGGGGESGSQGGRGFGPPPEAFAACEGKREGASAQFTNPKGEVVAGKCRIADGKLVLRPDQPKEQGREGRQGPPPEAYAACKGKKASSTSQFVDPQGETLKGTCEEEDGNMVLRPDRNKGGRRGQAPGDAGPESGTK